MPDPLPLHSLGIGLAAALAVYAVQRFLRLHGARTAGADTGEIAPNAGLILAVCTIGLGIAAAAIWATLTVPGSFPALPVGTGALVLTAASGWSLHSVWVIRWTAEGVEGPSAALPGPGNRTWMAWDSITAAGRDMAGNFYVQHWDGTRIRWNVAYGGYGHLVQAVERNCPHLFPGPAAVA